VPFWHTTVVELFGGTTTVVFAGGGGLELLMQPLNNPAATSTPAAIVLTDTLIVIVASFGSRITLVIGVRIVAEATRSRQRRISQTSLSVRLHADSHQEMRPATEASVGRRT
jgi:hypothetical protein